MKALKHIVDTTLRDGEQSPGYALTKEQKVFIAKLLDDAGVYQIEAGIPAIGAYEVETIHEIIENRKNSIISVWSRLNMKDVKQACRLSADIVHISVPVSYPQIYTKLRKNKAWILKTAQACVELARGHGFEVTVGFEDASRADATFMVKLATMLKDMGASRIRFADTVGILTPSRTFSAISELISYTGMEIEMHAHNDLGMAVANSIAAAKAGANYIDTTILGIGERAGNCDMQKLIFVAELLFKISPNRFTALTVEEKASDILAPDRFES